ncbi:hypothetical protein [Frigoriglobus tundricola]|uniref:Uncharacterized protein n=1 Tax=Frigoriglobus tundricola TaxID=2774151 RepID=A0A6M5YNY7_9BACT|nr:hypothetical protein [Frigoriglobus tundricola]QJW94951.1 Uncharacterized protein FTUN_2477 [Frigoriglobus tundricola]
MEPSPAELIARALLYEGYILYPYRASALKNRHRWTFGGLLPRAYAEASDGTERWFFRTECLVCGDATLSARVRFLHPVLKPARGSHGQEATEREVAVPDLRLAELAGAPRCEPFAFPGWRSVDGLQQALAGEVACSAERVAEGVFRVAVRVANLTAMEVSGHTTRADAVPLSLASAHAALDVRGGEFVSLLDPPEPVRSHAERCRNEGVWPVLVGAGGGRTEVLASPIILDDYPRVAPQSPGDFFDGCEIDEMLVLRVLTLTDDEKREMRAADPRAGAVLGRVEALTGARLAALHGTTRTGPHPGARVRLRPRGRADAFDVLLAGAAATVVSVEEDLEGTVYVAVTIDADPGADAGANGQIGHRFFYRADEVEPLGTGGEP